MRIDAQFAKHRFPGDRPLAEKHLRAGSGRQVDVDAAAKADQAYAFLIFRTQVSALVGGLTLANIRRGVAQAGSIGYWIGQPYANQGYMSAAVRALIPFCFGSLRLHRLEAACIPTNKPSITLLEKCGFQREGYARGYLCINGTWQDHLLYARLQTDSD